MSNHSRNTPSTVSSTYTNSPSILEQRRKVVQHSARKKRRGAMLQGKAMSALRTKQHYTNGSLLESQSPAVGESHFTTFRKTTAITGSVVGINNSSSVASSNASASTINTTLAATSAPMIHPVPIVPPHSQHHYTKPLSRSSSLTSGRSTPGKSILRTPSRPNTPLENNTTHSGGLGVERRVRWWDDSSSNNFSCCSAEELATPSVVVLPQWPPKTSVCHQQQKIQQKLQKKVDPLNYKVATTQTFSQDIILPTPAFSAIAPLQKSQAQELEQPISTHHSQVKQADTLKITTEKLMVPNSSKIETEKLDLNDEKVVVVVEEEEEEEEEDSDDDFGLVIESSELSSDNGAADRTTSATSVVHQPWIVRKKTTTNSSSRCVSLSSVQEQLMPSPSATPINPHIGLAVGQALVVAGKLKTARRKLDILEQSGRGELSSATEIESKWMQQAMAAAASTSSSSSITGTSSGGSNSGSSSCCGGSSSNIVNPLYGAGSLDEQQHADNGLFSSTFVSLPNRHSINSSNALVSGMKNIFNATSNISNKSTLFSPSSSWQEVQHQEQGADIHERRTRRAKQRRMREMEQMAREENQQGMYYEDKLELNYNEIGFKKKRKENEKEKKKNILLQTKGKDAEEGEGGKTRTPMEEEVNIARVAREAKEAKEAKRVQEANEAKRIQKVEKAKEAAKVKAKQKQKQKQKLKKMKNAVPTRKRSVRSTRGISPLDKWRFLGTMPTK
jgi:hypothetical protein